jgi:hypothetical protein
MNTNNFNPTQNPYQDEMEMDASTSGVSFAGRLADGQSPDHLNPKQAAEREIRGNVFADRETAGAVEPASVKKSRHGPNAR